MGRRSVPPLIAVPIEMGKEPRRERPRLGAHSLPPHLFKGRSRLGSRWPVCPEKWDGFFLTIVSRTRRAKALNANYFDGSKPCDLTTDRSLGRD
jgi:hypothetical protein